MSDKILRLIRDGQVVFQTIIVSMPKKPEEAYLLARGYALVNDENYDCFTITDANIGCEKDGRRAEK